MIYLIKLMEKNKMNTIRYNEQNVYTTSNMETSFDDLDKARKKPATIKEAYFFNYSSQFFGLDKFCFS